jgi:hypothetical protein
MTMWLISGPVIAGCVAYLARLAVSYPWRAPVPPLPPDPIDVLVAEFRAALDEGRRP